MSSLFLKWGTNVQREGLSSAFRLVASGGPFNAFCRIWITFVWLVTQAEALGTPLAPILIVATVFAELVTLVLMFGFMAVAPNEARVLLLFGVYQGSVIESGFYWVNPFFNKRKISLRIRNLRPVLPTSPR
jgi:hypothetical protein